MSALSRYNHTVRYAAPVFVTLLFLLSMAFPGSGRGQPITQGFNNFDTGTRPAGWIFNGCNSNGDTYTSAGNFGFASPSIKLDTTGDYIQTASLFHPDQLSFWVKGQGTDISSALLVEEYYSGAGWSEVTTVMPLPIAGTNLGPFALDFLSTTTRFSYTKSAGDLAFDDVGITAGVPSPTVTPSPPPTATPTLTPIPPPTPTPYTNVPNPSFELDPALVGWTKVAAKETYVARSSDQAYQGIFSCTFSDTGYVSDNYADQGIRSGAVSSIIGGDEYYVGGWFYVAYEKGSVNATLFKFNIEWLSEGVVISTDSDTDWPLMAFDTWEKKEYQVTAPVEADQVRLYIAAKETTNNNNNVYIDVFYVNHGPAIFVTAPNTGAAWYVGESDNIMWESHSLTGNVDIDYSTNGSAWAPIATNVADTGIRPWTVPNDPSTQARVRVREAGGGGVSGQSGLFRIAATDTINVLSPKGGETWYRTGVYDIDWSYGVTVGPGAVDLSYSIDNGGSWIPIASGIALGSSPYPWTVPDVNSSQALVRVRQSVAVSGQSPAVFTIASPFFTVKSPKGGEVWYYGDNHAITWTSTAGISGNVNIDYSISGPSGPWFQIAANRPNSGSYYPWTIPNVTTTEARVRISEIGGIGLPGISAANFTLKGLTPPQPYVPLGWELWVDLANVTQGCGINAIEAFDNDNIWIGCSCGLVYHWNGSVWELQALLGGNINEFVALAADNVYGSGSGGGDVYHYNGLYWEIVSEGLGKTNYSIDAPDPDHIMVGGASGTILYSESGEWNDSTIGESGSLYGCVYLKPDEAFVLRHSSTTYEASAFFSDDGGYSWDRIKDFGTWTLYDHPLGGCIDQYGNTLLWVVGACGEIDHYDGSSWYLQTQSLYGTNFQCIEVLDENNAWTSGDGQIFHYNGSEWIVEKKLSTIYQFSAVDNRHVYAIGSSGATKIYRSWANPTPTPYKPTPIGYQSPSPTPVPVNGPISGRVYDRVTGAGVGNVYVRALPLEAGLRPGGGFTNSSGNYSIPDLLAGIYNVYCDSNQGSGIRVYRSQWYNQKDSQARAGTVSSNTAGINFPLYKDGVYPSPTTTPAPDFGAISVAGGDYNGDGMSDIAVFRGSQYGLWAVRGITRVYYGNDGDIPVSGDYDGDGCTDIALFRDTSGLWAVRGMTRSYFGGLGDLPVPGDYDGDGVCDWGIFRPTAGLWAVNGLGRVYFGGSGDIPAIADYDGDGFMDVSVFRSATRMWAAKDVTRFYFGGGDDAAIPGDYSGSGTASAAIYRSSSGLWAIRGISRVYFGGVGRQPVPADYNGDFRDDMGVFRPGRGIWAVRGISRVYFGATGDLPATK